MPSPPSRPGLYWTTRTLRPDRRIDQRHRRGQPVGLFPVREGRDKSQPQTAQIGLLLRPQRAASHIFPSSHGFVIVRLRSRRQSVILPARAHASCGPGTSSVKDAPAGFPGDGGSDLVPRPCGQPGSWRHSGGPTPICPRRPGTARWCVFQGPSVPERLAPKTP